MKNLNTLYKKYIRPLLTKKWRHLYVFFTIFIAALYLVIKYSGDNTAVILSSTIGIMALLSELILGVVVPPILDVDVKEVPTSTVGGQNQKWYHLVVTNKGFREAKNVRVKLRDDLNKSWVNLNLPFVDLREGTSKIEINNLASKEDEEFDIGYIDQTANYFQLTPNIVPLNQKFGLKPNEEHEYFFEVVAGNASSARRKIKIINLGYKNMSVVDSFKVERL